MPVQPPRFGVRPGAKQHAGGYPRKNSAEKKIDNPVALIMAMGVALSGEEAETFEYTGM